MFLILLSLFLGMILGFFEGLITIGFVIFFIERVPLSENIMEMIANSIVAPISSGVASILWPLLPDALRMLQSTVDYVGNIVL